MVSVLDVLSHAGGGDEGFGPHSWVSPPAPRWGLLLGRLLVSSSVSLANVECLEAGACPVVSVCPSLARLVDEAHRRLALARQSKLSEVSGVGVGLAAPPCVYLLPAP